jgi:uncharacterized protein YdeI (BOF family)
LAIPAAVYGIQDAISAETSVQGKVVAVFGNRLVLENDTGKVLVDGGPSWYRDLDFDLGEQVAVTGQLEHGKFEALTIRRADGSLVTVRSTFDQAPWAGKRRGMLDRLYQTAAGLFETDSALEGTVGDVFGNSFVVAGSAGAVLVDVGPAWYQQIDVRSGERVSVTGRLEDDTNLDAIVIVREDGTMEQLRPASGPPPWAGKRRQLLSALY